MNEDKQPLEVRPEDVEEEPTPVPEEKPWWTSKTIWWNLLGIIVVIAGYFGFNEDFSRAWMPIILPLINILLRGVTNSAIKPFWKAE